MRDLKLINLDRIQETEDYDLEGAIRLADLILDLGIWTVPITIEHSTFAIMDGHHRLNAAKLLSLSRVPCIMMDYNKSGVVVRSWRTDLDISAANIFLMIQKNEKYPLKTTRHLFNPPIQEVEIPLSLLY